MQIWPQVKAENAHLSSVCELGAVVGSLWRDMDPTQKQEYNELYAKDKVTVIVRSSTVILMLRLYCFTFYYSVVLKKIPVTHVVVNGLLCAYLPLINYPFTHYYYIVLHVCCSQQIEVAESLL